MSSNVSGDSIRSLPAGPEATGMDDLALQAKKALAPIDVSEICTGCRCGWLSCNCHIGCVSCKERRRYCFCSWNAYFGIEDACMFCDFLRPSCQCSLERRCKWCVVSVAKCRRGGCIKKLPDRLSPGAQIYVDIFNLEDGPDDDDILVGGGGGGGKDDEISVKEEDLPGVVPPAPGLSIGNLPVLASPSASLGSSVEYYGAESTSLDLESSFGSQDSFETFEGEGERCSR